MAMAWDLNLEYVCCVFATVCDCEQKTRSKSTKCSLFYFKSHNSCTLWLSRIPVPTRMGFVLQAKQAGLPSERAVVYARDAVSLLKTVTNNCWHTPLFLFHAHNQHRFLQAKYTLNETDS